MNDWTAGYVADIGYTFGYYQELNPLRLKLAFLNAGLAFPEVGCACELGFGQGVSTNLHAAASLTQWHGTDFNPGHASFARELAHISGSDAHLRDDAFADFCNRADLPEFDFIGLHGIWSWISEANRATLVDFIRRKLKTGGVVYISYNTLPGWSGFAPVRHLMTQHAASMGAEGTGIVSRIDASIDFTEALLATKPLYARVNPSVRDQLTKVKGQNRHYVAHEYFNADWDPMYFSDVAKRLAPAKLSFACSANLHDQVDAINLSREQQDLLKTVPDADLRQTVRDFMVYQRFRKDYWVKGPRRLSALAQAEALRQLRVVLVSPRDKIELTVKGATGEAQLSEKVYRPVLDALAKHLPRTLAELEQSVKAQGVNFAMLRQAIVVMAGSGHVALAQSEAVVRQSRTHTDKLNAHLLRKARGDADVPFLASPVTGGGVSVGRFSQLFLLARSTQPKGGDPAQWAQAAWTVLAAQGHRLRKDGEVLESAEDNLAMMRSHADTFAQAQLPILQALQIA